ncbi:MAG: hypothetical protein JW779_14045 [Candidatus Thorarchaeota archaeon]|nr:hypothetical protein [Candidatus Thorarchaeota archaeon]
MSPKKYYFDEPLVRVSLSRVRFPKICPVCGAPSTTTTRYTIETGRKQYLLRSWDPYYAPNVRRRQGIITPNLNVLQINVCEKHYYSDEGEYRYKSLCLVTDGLAIAFMVFGLMFIGDAISRSRAIPFWAMIFIYFFILSMIASAIAFRPNKLLRSVRIIGFDPGMQYVLLAFENPSYREVFLKENPMNSELVSWVLKA